MNENRYTNEELKMALRASELTQNEALRWIYQHEKWRRSVDKLVLNMGGDLANAKDVFQEGIAIFARKVMQGEFKGDSALLTYFIGICRNCSLRKFQKGTNTSEDISKLADKGIDSPEDVFITRERSKEQKKIMRFLMGQLKEKCQRVLTMYSLKYSMDEIANEMGYGKAQAAKNAALKCRNKLREMIVSNESIYQKVQEII